MTLASIAALAAGMAFAQSQTPAPQPGPGKAAGKARFARRAGLRPRMMQALNLTDAQKAQAKSIFQQARQTAQPLRAQLKQDRESIAAAVKAGNTTQIQQLSTDEGNLMGRMIAIRTEAMAKFYNSLTPEQKAKADQMRERMHQRMQQRFGKAKNG
jgi:Spy/CpxP family protein refolding chaperone